MIRTCTHELDDGIDRLLIISDVHAHLPPIEAFDAARAKMPGRCQVVFNGDLFMGGPRPAEAAQWLVEQVGDLATIGNHDEAMLQGADGHQPPYAEAGAYERLSEAQRDYFRARPHRLQLHWRGYRIVLMHGHRTPDGRGGSWLATPQRQIADFTDPEADLCITSHTHWPFVQANGSGLYANSGSLSVIILGVQGEDGLHVQSGAEAIAPNEDVRTSFLAVTESDGRLDVRIVRFDRDRQAMLADMAAVDQPGLDMFSQWLADGIVRP